MEKFAFSTLKNICDDLNSHVDRNRIANITFINSRDLLISFTTFREEKFLVSLNHQSPFCSFVKVNESYPTIVGQANDTLRKNLRNGLVKSVQIVNEDRILQIEIEKTNDYFEKETRYLVFELIPHRPNLILLDENRVVLYAFHYSSLDNKYLVMKGFKYEPLLKNNEYSLNISGISVENMKILAKKYLQEAKEQRSKEKFDTLFRHIKSKIKSHKNKLKILDQEMESANKDLVYKDHGDMVLAYAYDKESLDEYLALNNLTLKDDYTIGENANVFYKKYKKAKRTIEMDKLEKEKAMAEIERLTAVSNTLPFMNEDDLFELGLELLPNKYQIKNNKKPKSKISYVMCDNVKIMFGKNQNQNDELTFKIANKSHFYLHVKDYHGSHVIIASDNPTNEMKLLASEIALIMSGLSAGEIYIAQVKDVKKGSSKGQALLTSYTTINLNKVREETIELLKSSI